jgi:hypothetical protein
MRKQQKSLNRENAIETLQLFHSKQVFQKEAAEISLPFGFQFSEAVFRATSAIGHATHHARSEPECSQHRFRVGG